MRERERQKLDIPEPLFDTTFRVRDTETPQSRNSTGLRAVIFLSSLTETQKKTDMSYRQHTTTNYPSPTFAFPPNIKFKGEVCSFFNVKTR